MIKMIMIEKNIKKHFKTWRAYARYNGSNDGSNLKRRIAFYIKNLNEWLKPLNLKVVIKEIN